MVGSGIRTGPVTSPLLLGTLAIGLVLFALFYAAVQQDLSDEMFRAHSVIQDTMQILGPSLVGVLVLSYALLILLMVWWSRHVAGPMLRLRLSLDRLADGQSLEPIRLRRGDIGLPLVESVNRIAEHPARPGDETNELSDAVAEGRMEPGVAFETLAATVRLKFGVACGDRVVDCVGDAGWSSGDGSSDGRLPGLSRHRSADRQRALHDLSFRGL